MPHKDPKRRREYDKQRSRKRRAANPEKHAAYQRAYMAANREELNRKRRAVMKEVRRLATEKRVRKAVRKERERIARIAKARAAIRSKWDTLALWADTPEARESFRLHKPEFRGVGL